MKMKIIFGTFEIFGGKKKSARFVHTVVCCVENVKSK